MDASDFCDRLLEHGFGPFTGVPCSLVGELIAEAQERGDTRYVPATSEGEAMGIAAGWSLAGRLPVTIMQNDGLGNAVNPLSSLQSVYDLPVLMVITWRGDPNGPADAVQHRMMGRILPDLLEMLEVPHLALEEGSAELDDALRQAHDHIHAEERPFAFLVGDGYFDRSPAQGDEESADQSLRIDYIRELEDELTEQDLVVATTGYTGREAYSVFGEGPLFYMAGSMGCAASIGLGLALEEPDRRVIVLDGDGAALMKLGTLATIGEYRPENLLHVVFDNGCYESTGHQPTVSDAVDFEGLGRSLRYRNTASVSTTDGFRKHIADRDRPGPRLLHVRIPPGSVPDLQRPDESGPALRDRFRDRIEGASRHDESSSS